MCLKEVRIGDFGFIASTIESELSSNDIVLLCQVKGFIACKVVAKKLPVCVIAVLRKVFFLDVFNKYYVDENSAILTFINNSDTMKQ